MTLTTHLIAVEADYLIDEAGPIKESMELDRAPLWTSIRYRKRRRVCQNAGKQILSSCLLRHHIECWQEEPELITW